MLGHGSLDDELGVGLRKEKRRIDGELKGELETYFHSLFFKANLHGCHSIQHGEHGLYGVTVDYCTLMSNFFRGESVVMQNSVNFEILFEKQRKIIN